jgi:hypothetical protein
LAELTRHKEAQFMVSPSPFLSPKAFVPLAVGASVAASIFAAAPAKALILIDSFNSPAAGITLNTANASVNNPISSPNTSLLGVSRQVSLGTGNNQTLTINSLSNPDVLRFVSNANGNGQTRTATLSYTGFSQNFLTDNAFQLSGFSYTPSSGSSGALGLTVYSGSSNATFTSTPFTTTTLGNQLISFTSFTGVNFNAITRIDLFFTLTRGGTFTANSFSTVTAPVPVPVPPAAIATGLSALIGTLKITRRRKQESAVAEASEGVTG